MVRYHFHVDPDTLTDDELAKAWGQLKYVLITIGQMKESY